ncbi:hypothetical protein HMPREF9628_02283, partial [Peptoanaerobacter stomatis]
LMTAIMKCCKTCLICLMITIEMLCSQVILISRLKEPTRKERADKRADLSRRYAGKVSGQRICDF